MNFKCHNCKAVLAASEFDIGAKAKCPACGEVTVISLPYGAKKIEYFTNGRALGSFLCAVFAAITLGSGYYLLYVRRPPFEEEVLRYVVYSLVGAVMAGLFFSIVLGFGAFRAIKSRGPEERGKGYAAWGLLLGFVMLAALAYYCYAPIVNQYAGAAFEKLQSLVGGTK